MKFHLGEPVVLESSTKDIEVNEGDSVILTCNTQGELLHFVFAKEYPFSRIWVIDSFLRVSSSENRMAKGRCGSSIIGLHSSSGM